jgi:hypothetical protein
MFRAFRMGEQAGGGVMRQPQISRVGAATVLFFMGLVARTFADEWRAKLMGMGLMVAAYVFLKIVPPEEG